ncbi:hypothetical protein [Paludibaculum fermentans]|uniref:Transmembrane protein n=1 Tax=Paludibaculum fermentans TaxID=1473598 RepID=A0A7S7SKU9_PALFE|nr:hypothetical protein [Paludibaculum fermentans]QOY89557.1 hypothetical protein IRI77_06280 [Paludibaculum fermentans]
MPSTQPPAFLYPTTLCLLAAYALGVLYGLVSPSSDPQRGMAQGFLIFMLLVVLGFAGLSWLGTHPYRPWLAWAVFVICVFPAVSLSAQGIYWVIRMLRKE